MIRCRSILPLAAAPLWLAFVVFTSALSGCHAFTPSVGDFAATHTAAVTQQVSVQVASNKLMWLSIAGVLAGVFVLIQFPKAHISTALMVCGALGVLISLFLPAVVPAVQASSWVVCVVGVALFIGGGLWFWKHREDVDAKLSPMLRIPKQ